MNTKINQINGSKYGYFAGALFTFALMIFAFTFAVMPKTASACGYYDNCDYGNNNYGNNYDGYYMGGMGGYNNGCNSCCNNNCGGYGNFDYSYTTNYGTNSGNNYCCNNQNQGMYGTDPTMGYQQQQPSQYSYWQYPYVINKYVDVNKYVNIDKYYLYKNNYNTAYGTTYPAGAYAYAGNGYSNNWGGQGYGSNWNNNQYGSGYGMGYYNGMFMNTSGY